MPLFNDSSSLIYPPHPGFVSGKYYSSSIYTANNSTNLAVGFVYYTYFFVPFQQNFNRVGFTTNASYANAELVRFAVYKVASGLPSTLVADLGEISFTSAGFKEISCSLSLSPGWYAIGCNFTPNALSIFITSVFLSNLLGVTTPASVSVSGFRATLAYGAFPSSPSLVNLSETTPPLIWLKAG